jgi:hypothetical protein
MSFLCAPPRSSNFLWWRSHLLTYMPKVPTYSCRPQQAWTDLPESGRTDGSAFGPRTHVGLPRMIGPPRTEISKYAYRRMSLSSCWLGGKSIKGSMWLQSRVQFGLVDASPSDGKVGIGLASRRAAASPPVLVPWKNLSVAPALYIRAQGPPRILLVLVQVDDIHSYISIAPDTRWPAKPLV